MCAFDLPDPEARQALAKRLLEEWILILPCGPRSLRFRPTLDFGAEHADEAVAAIKRGLREIPR